jgi:hypothetical protein
LLPWALLGHVTGWLAAAGGTLRLAGMSVSRRGRQTPE